MNSLVITVRFHDGRYHGSGDWPPSPARLFQALVAGAARGGALSPDDAAALRWLETLPPPVIAVPPSQLGQGYRSFVPNNDLDAVGGDPARIGEVRAPKPIRPRHFEADAELTYMWSFDPGAAAKHAETICRIAARLYQLGRGVDMGWARGDVLDAVEANTRIAASGHVLRKPSRIGSGAALACPQPGSLASLEARFSAMRRRLRTLGSGRKAKQLFAQAPKAHFAQVPYDSPHSLLLFDIRDVEKEAFAPQNLKGVAALTQNLRDQAASRLKRAMPDHATAIERTVVGHDSTEVDKARRVRIMPLPTIGHPDAIPSIRRVLVDVPPDSPVRATDITWAFSGLSLAVDAATGEIAPGSPILVVADDESMLAHYGIGDVPVARLWRTVTPAALPQGAARRRIDPGRMREEAKGGAERQREEAAAVEAARQALRHAGIAARPKLIRVQREPFAARGQRAEAFARDTRFAKERLWHVEIGFEEPVAGPLVIGDGRYLGLGLMTPDRKQESVFGFLIAEGLAGSPPHGVLARALRRAIMARVQDVIGERKELPLFFSGHASDGSVARQGGHEHLAYAFDPARRLLLVVAPHLLEHRSASRQERDNLAILARALQGMIELRAGRAGRFRLEPAQPDVPETPLLTASRQWESVTPYRVTRHAKKADAATALRTDMEAECKRARLPRVRIEVLDTRSAAGEGLSGRARLVFATAVPGPILLGRDRHFGGGLFAPV